MPLEPLLRPFSDVMVLQPVVDLAEVNNPMCRRFLQVCDGTRTIAEVAHLYHLSPDTMIKVVSRCFERGWAEFESIEYLRPIQQIMLTHLGEERAWQIILQAASTNRRRPDGSLTTLATEGLFAIEMQLTEEEQEKLLPLFEDLQQQYGER